MTANRRRGEISAELDGREYRLCLTLGALAERFDLDRTIWLPWASEFFTPRGDYTSPVSGSLSEMGQMQLEALKVARRIHHNKLKR